MKFYDTKEASARLKELGVNERPSTMAKNRCLGVGAKYRKDGKRVIYAETDLDDYAAERISAPVRSTVEVEDFRRYQIEERRRRLAEAAEAKRQRREHLARRPGA